MKVAIDGMHCQACVARVRKALEKVNGARVEDVQVGSALVSVEREQEAAVLEAVRKAGYQPQVSG